jgi:hypothetical protein
MNAIPNGGNGKGKAVFTIADIGVHFSFNFAGWTFALIPVACHKPRPCWLLFPILSLQDY